jgi:lysozyme family protein
LKSDIILQTQVKTLYKTNYWNTIWGDKITNQDVANDLYDTGVNMGVAMSIKLAQRQFHMTQTGKMSDELLKKLNSVTSRKK